MFKFGNIVFQRLMDKGSIRRMYSSAHNLLNDVPHPHPLHAHPFGPVCKTMGSNPLLKLKLRNATILKMTL